jgi:hypothetical protein
MAEKTFTEKQKEIVARKLGYEGPMNMFDKYLNSSPADAQKYGTIVEKFMAKGGMVKGYAEGGVVSGIDPTTGLPIKIDASTVTPATQTATADQTLNTELAPTQATQVTAAPAVTATTTASPTPTVAPTMTASTAAPAVTTAVEDTQAAQGTVLPQAQVTAAQATPTETALKDLQAAQGTATTVQNAPVRQITAEEMVSGPAVEQAKVDAALAQNQAAQGIVTAEMTTQGQLNQLLTDFDSGNPPAWASASLRNATAVLAARGLGTSSLAGQAIIQATLESAIPIAAQDAAVFQQMGLQNLSNRQQTAILTAQQRAQFLGQEFDQAFQTRVANAAKISDVANMNFSAQQQVALENARMAQTMDLANLTNSQAVVMATAAQIANLETANLNNRQQAAVVNAQSFLQMDMANLANEQQVEMFRSQSIVQSLLTDTAAQNAAKQFNATSEMQTDQFFANLTTQVGQFNATQSNAMAQFNTQQTNAIAQFNTETQNQRDQFNAQNRLVIDQSNAQWRREISTANTAAINRANEFNATKAQEISMVEYNNIWQQLRDEIEYSFKASESTKEQANLLARQEISSNATIVAATIAKDADIAKTIGSSAASIISGTDVAGLAKAGFDTISKYGGPVLDQLNTWVGDFFTPEPYSGWQGATEDQLIP